VYIFQGIIICVIKEQCSNQGEPTWIAQNGCHKTMIDILCQSELCHIADTPVANFASMERERYFAYHHGSCAWRLVAEMHKWRTGSLYRHNKHQHAPGPIVNLSVHRVSVTVGHVNQLINQRLGHLDAYTEYWPPLQAKKIATQSLPNHGNECLWRANDFWLRSIVNESAMWPSMAIYTIVTGCIG